MRNTLIATQLNAWLLFLVRGGTHVAGKFEVKKSNDGQVFNLKATIGQVVLTRELYKQKICAEKGIESVRKNAAREGAFETKVRRDVNRYLICPRHPQLLPIMPSWPYLHDRAIWRQSVNLLYLFVGNGDTPFGPICPGVQITHPRESILKAVDHDVTTRRNF